MKVIVIFLILLGIGCNAPNKTNERKCFRHEVEINNNVEVKNTNVEVKCSEISPNATTIKKCYRITGNDRKEIDCAEIEKKQANQNK